MQQEALVNMLAGGLAGVVETSLTYPLDLAKTRQQLSLTKSQPVPQVLAQAYRSDGFFALFRGVGAPLVSEVPRRALKFTLNGESQWRLKAIFPERSVPCDVAIGCASGAFAGASETVIHTPFEVVKIRMQGLDAPKGAGIVSTASDLMRAGGVRGLYVGFEAYALRQAVWNGAFFGFIGLGKALVPEGVAPRALKDFTIGLLSGSFATCLNNPLDVAKSRIQGGVLPGVGRGSQWSVQVAAGIAREEGLRGMCKGLPARLYRSAPGHGLLYMGFEFFARLLRGGDGVAK